MDKTNKILLIACGILIFLVSAWQIVSYMSYIPIKVANNNNDTYFIDGVSFKSPVNWTVYTSNVDGDKIIDINKNKLDYPYFQIQITSNPTDESDQDAINEIQNSSDPDESSCTTLISNNTLTIDNETAYETTSIIKDYTKFNQTMKEEDITLVKNGKTYFMYFLAQNNEFNNEKPNIDLIINSFKVR